MVKLDDDFLRECGLYAMTADDRHALLKHIYDDLEIRVGTALTRACSDIQMDSLDELISREASDTEMQAWLETNIPDYSKAVEAALNDIKKELKLRAHEILRVASIETPLDSDE